MRQRRPGMLVLAKVTQALGLADVGYALVVGVATPHGMGWELWLLAVGIGVFALGRLLERRASAGG